MLVTTCVHSKPAVMGSQYLAASASYGELPPEQRMPKSSSMTPPSIEKRLNVLNEILAGLRACAMVFAVHELGYAGARGAFSNRNICVIHKHRLNIMSDDGRPNQSPIESGRSDILRRVTLIQFVRDAVSPGVPCEGSSCGRSRRSQRAANFHAPQEAETCVLTHSKKWIISPSRFVTSPRDTPQSPSALKKLRR